MAVEYLGVATSGAASGSNPRQVIIGKPTGLSVNDLLIASLVLDQNFAPIVAPAGWTLVRASDYGSVWHQHTFLKRIAAGEGSSYTFTDTGSGSPAFSGLIGAYRNVSFGSPVNVNAEQFTATRPGTDPERREAIVPSVTPTASGMLLCLWGWRSPTSAVTYPGGVNGRATVGSNNNAMTALGDKLVTAGATGTQNALAATGSADAGDYQSGHAIVLAEGHPGLTMVV